MGKDESIKAICQELHLLPGSKTIRYSPGSVIFREGTPIYCLYCLSHGKVKLTKTEQDGKEVILQIMGPDNIIAHRCFFSKEEFSTSATALEESEVLLLEKNQFENYLYTHPEMFKNLLSYLSEQLELSDIRMSALMRKKVSGRIADFFLSMMEDFGTVERGEKKLNIHLSREEIASIVGTSAETVTRFVTEYKQLGLISEKEKCFYINDTKSLEEISRQS